MCARSAAATARQLYDVRFKTCRVDGVNINVTFGRETQPRLVADDEAAAPPTYDVCSMA